MKVHILDKRGMFGYRKRLFQINHEYGKMYVHKHRNVYIWKRCLPEEISILGNIKNINRNFCQN